MADSFDLESLKEMAQQLRPQSEESPNHEQHANDFERSSPIVYSLPALEQNDDLDDEEYHEFPRLEKFKTYDVGVIKKPGKPIPIRETVLKCNHSDVVIHLQDTELYESTASGMNIKPIMLKNSYAIFEGLESSDSLTFTQDSLGNYLMVVVSGEDKEEVGLGCIVKFEFVRPNFTNLTLSSRDIDGEIAVVGASCSIEFLEEHKSRTQETEAASIRRLNSTHKVSNENKEAGKFTWTI